MSAEAMSTSRTVHYGKKLGSSVVSVAQLIFVSVVLNV